MPTPVSTGQITIVDTNDARPITAYITASPGMQQVLTKDDAVTSFVPSWFTANSNTGVQLTARVFIGGASVSEATGVLGSRQFSTSVGGTPITTASSSTDFVNDSNVQINNPFTVLHDSNGSYLRIKGNLKDTVAVWTVFFEGNYTDPATGLITKVISQIMLNSVKTGGNAVFVTVRGTTSIEPATGVTKEVIAIGADLVRSSGIDITDVSYKWYEAGGATHISTSTPGYATKYGLKTTASGSSPTSLVSELGINIPTANGPSPHNTLVIGEAAILKVGTYKVAVTDDVGKIYEQYFTINDVSDPYTVGLSSSSGDKLQNGQGSTVITPSVWYGAAAVSNLTGWSFEWKFFDKLGRRGAFVNTSKISTPGGGLITANTATVTGNFNCASVTAGMFVAGEVIKAVKLNGDAFYYEVGATSTTGNVVIRAASTNAWLTGVFPAPSLNEFVNGRLYGCTAQGIITTSGVTGITVSGDEIDVKGRIDCTASKP